ncbi:MAG: hypothetical protein KKH91_08250 [Elusimicrobia bacterium]|nr:hypothetical protein [Elusimicrobiota bacterium]
MGSPIYTLQGSVRDQNLKPVDNKKIDLLFDNNQLCSLNTEKDGTFIFNNDKVKDIYENDSVKLTSSIDGYTVSNISISRKTSQMPNGMEVRVVSAVIDVKRNKILGFL